MCLTRRRDVEQNIRQRAGFGGVSAGAKALNKVGATAPARDEPPKSLFAGQRSTQPWGTLEVRIGNAQDVGTDGQKLAASLVLLLNPPKTKHQPSAGWWLLMAALGVQCLWKLTDKQSKITNVSSPF